MGTPADYRKNAADCVKLASKAAHPKHREILLDLAKQWRKLAGASEHEIELMMKTAGRD